MSSCCLTLSWKLHVSVLFNKPIHMESSSNNLSSSATTQDNLDDKLRKFEIRDMMGLTDDRDISETVSETWSTDVLGSDFDPNMDEDRLQEIAGRGHGLVSSVSYMCTHWVPASTSKLIDLHSLWDHGTFYYMNFLHIGTAKLNRFREMSSPCGIGVK